MLRGSRATYDSYTVAFLSVVGLQVLNGAYCQIRIQGKSNEAISKPADYYDFIMSMYAKKDCPMWTFYPGNKCGILEDEPEGTPPVPMEVADISPPIESQAAVAEFKLDVSGAKPAPEMPDIQETNSTKELIQEVFEQKLADP